MNEAPSNASRQRETAEDRAPDLGPAEAEVEAAPEQLLTPLLVPADGVPQVVIDERRLVAAGRAIAAGSGPVAIDAERASGHRYGQRAYLVQLRREGSGTWLVDPIACPDLAPVAEGIGDAEWVLHAATQDLPCLAEIGLRPTRLFDTELGARLVGLPRVGLGAAVEHYLGLSLAKEHSAVDWSTRPLPEPWVRYAALDVEVLVQLRDAIDADLQAQGKQEWARQEFESLTHFEGPPVRVDPWRRTSGMHRVRKRRGVAAVRELWLARDRLAAQRDISPGRVLPDGVIVELAMRSPTSRDDIETVRELRPARRAGRVWLDALRRSDALPESQLPQLTLPAAGPPTPRAWADRDPVAAARLAAARQGLAAYGEQRIVPVENVLTPDLLRRVLWTPPKVLDEASFAAALTALGARPWQVEIAAPIIAAACLLPDSPPGTSDSQRPVGSGQDD
ncbi:HRDC domain-containing protein [Lapillicoccus sp.]|uniref:HRDC domain-containing protein n=1 Tax=Lapillicoccus sp. TaxID=1909287 RepID=UPI00326722B1